MVDFLLRERNEIIDRSSKALIVNLEEIVHHLLVLLQVVDFAVVEVIPFLEHSGNSAHLVLNTL